MKRTKKYLGATAILTFPHSTQNELYQELNRLGWFWNSKINQWERDDRQPTSNSLIKVRVWAKKELVEIVAQHLIESSEEIGIYLVEISTPYPCRPPHQLESRIYLTFQDEGE